MRINIISRFDGNTELSHVPDHKALVAYLRENYAGNSDRAGANEIEREDGKMFTPEEVAEILHKGGQLTIIAGTDWVALDCTVED